MTMEQLFPGNVGRMRMTRVMLRLKKPELREVDPKRVLPAELVAELQKALKELEAA